MTEKPIMANVLVTEHFAYHECVCPCCGRIRITPGFFEHMELLEVMRRKVGFPIIITSGYRCPEHNRAVGGVMNSQHLDFATDIRPVVKDVDDALRRERLDALYESAEALGFGGIGRYASHIHLDLRPGHVRWRGNYSRQGEMSCV